MQAQLQKLLDWLETKTQRERAIVLALSLAMLYLFWNIIFSAPISNKVAQIKTQKESNQQQINMFEQQLQTINLDRNQPADPKLVQENNNLKNQLAQADQQLKNVKQQSITSEQLTQEIKSLLEQHTELSLIRLENVSSTLTKTDAAKPQQSSNMEHTITLEFLGDYFNTVKYLQALADMPQHVNWQELDYTVDNYPEAKVVLKLQTREFN